MSIKSTIFTTKEELLAISDEWRELLENSECDTVFLTPEWIESWLNTSTKKIDLFAIAVYNGNQLIGIAPFYIANLELFRFFSYRCLRIAADQNTSSENQDLIIHRNYYELAINKVAHTLLENQNLFSFIWVPYTDVERGASKRFESLFSRIDFIHSSRSFEFHTITLPSSKSEFDSSLSSKQRNNIRRYTKKLTAGSDIELRNLADTMNSDQAFELLTYLHEARWQASGESGAFARKPEFANFLQSYSRLAHKQGLLAALCLYKDREPIAIRYGFIYKKVLYEIQAGFLPTFNGSGIVAIDKAIEYTIAHGLEKYDFLAYAGAYKGRFNASARSGRNYFAARSNIFTRAIFQFKIWPTGRFVNFS